MAWSWSHTNEAYENARKNVEGKSREWLTVVWAEWQSCLPNYYGFDEHRYQSSLKQAELCSTDVLADEVWENMRQQATCTNGGFEAHCCPFGCGGHMVPFDPVLSEDQEEGNK